MNDSQFGITIDEIRGMLGQKEVDLFVLRRELQRAEETGATLLTRVQELEAQLAKPAKNGHKVPVD